MSHLKRYIRDLEGQKVTGGTLSSPKAMRWAGEGKKETRSNRPVSSGGTPRSGFARFLSNARFFSSLAGLSYLSNLDHSEYAKHDPTNHRNRPYR